MALKQLNPLENRFSIQIPHKIGLGIIGLDVMIDIRIQCIQIQVSE